MIVQITRTKGELFLIKEMLPVWHRYADGFVFYDDGSDDGTVEYLHSVKEEYNILEVLTRSDTEDYVKSLKIETDDRQPLYEAALKYSPYIICCDTDEYLDGLVTKAQLEEFLAANKDTVCSLQWVQYTSKDQIRVDGPWGHNFKVRVGSYAEKGNLGHVQMHSLHLPPAKNNVVISPDHLFIAHCQWLDKRWVAVKQYFWKINDYINSTVHGAGVMGSAAYDVSVNNFQWLYAPAPTPLKIDADVFKNQDIRDSYKLKDIKRYTKELNIPNLGDWGVGIYDYAIKDD